MRLRGLAACSLLFVSPAACDPGTSTLSWSVQLADDALADRVEILEASIHRGTCDAPQGAPLYRAERRRGDDAAPMAPGALEPGTYAFSARARDGACTWFAAGCVDLELPRMDGERVDVRLEASEPQRACPREACWGGACVGQDDPGVACGAGAPTGLTCGAGGGEMIDVCRRAEPVDIDGDPGELRGATPIHIGRDDLSATLRLEWDCEALYVGAIVSDTELSAVVDDPTRSRDHPDLYTTDSVEVLLDMDATRSDLPDADDRHVIVNLNGLVWDAGGGLDRPPWWDATSFDFPDLRRELTLAGSPDDAEPDEGWAVELAIPWSALGVSACPASGRVIGLDLAVNDQRQIDGAPALHKTADWAGLAIYANPDQWNCMRLADAPAAP